MFRVYQADIKTVDGFCASLLREHVHLLEPVEGHSLTPDFRILDESEASLLKEKALEQALESFYQRIEQGDEGCASLAATLGAVGSVCSDGISFAVFSPLSAFMYSSTASLSLSLHL